MIKAAPGGASPGPAARLLSSIVALAALLLGLFAVLAPAASGAESIYWANASASKISVTSALGTGGGRDLDTTGATVSAPLGLAVDEAANKVYWANNAANKISMANLDGSGGGSDLNTTGATVSGPRGLAVNPATNKIYWANWSASKISVANLDGSGATDLNTSGATVINPAGIAIDAAANKIYWANQSGNKISFANLDGSGGGGDLSTSGATVNQPVGVAVDPAAGKIYWANYIANTISVANLDGSGGGSDLNTTGATVNRPVGLTVDPSTNRIYWANFSGNKISVANLDGSGGGSDLNTTGATVSGPNFPAVAGTSLHPAPQLTGSDPGSPANENNPKIKGTARADSTLALFTTADCSGTPVATGSPAELASPGLSVSVADDSTTTFKAVAYFDDGQSSTCSAGFTYVEDSTLPDTTINSGPSGVTNNASPSFGFSSSEGGSTFECKLDSGPFQACTSPKSYSGLGDGPHSVEVRAKDAAGNVDASPATRSFTVDTQAPDTLIDSGPSGLIANASPSFGFIADEPGAGFECRLDSGPFQACTSPKSYSGLADGPHSFDVRAKDAAGNVDASPASRSFTIDTQAPNTTINSGPSGPTTNASPSFAFSANEGGSTFECRLDSGSFGACNSPKSYSGLGEGAHSFQVRATDPAGNVDASPATRSFTVDTVAPSLSIDSGPSGPTTNPSPSFGFTAEGGSTVSCSIDTGSPNFGACSSAGTHSPAAPLADDSYTFRVRATDAAGNQTTETRAFSVDAQAPNTTVNSGPAGLTNNSSPSFGFSSSEGGSTFECRLDSESFETCSSPKFYSNLPDGAHSFAVRAIDQGGKADPSPASRSFTVDTQAPSTMIDSGPSGETTDPSPSFGFSSSEGGSSFECRLDSAGFQPCTSPESYSGLAYGPHSFEVRSTDPAGNTDATPASREFTVTSDSACDKAEKKFKSAKKKVKSTKKKLKKAKGRSAKKRAKKQCKKAKQQYTKAKKHLHDAC